jgi:energy-coupling factor transporter ATP-binding protein EcfA2
MSNIRTINEIIGSQHGSQHYNPFEQTMENLYTTTNKTHFTQPVHNWYVSEFKKLPSEFSLKRKVDCKKLIEKYKDKIITSQYFESEDGETKLLSFVLFLDCDKQIVFYATAIGQKSKDKNEETEYTSTILFNIKSNIKEVEGISKKLPYTKEIKQKEATLHLLSRDNFVGYHLKPMKVDFKNINIDLNYNDDLKDIDKVIIKGLKDLKLKNKGLTLLYGPPGTGKTTYIRSLAKRVKNKKFVLVPTNLTANLTEPTFLDFLSRMENLVLIIEESEQVLMKRDIKDNSSISNILNMSDGLLGDCINFKIIATFNTELKNIDDALLRKGRLLAKYEFKELSEEKAKILKNKIGAEHVKSNLLSEIYNPEDISFTSEKEKIGFKNYSGEIETKA